MLASQEQVVVMSLAGERYAAPITMVREILALQEITPIPGAPAFVVGVTNLRGKVIPVMDLRERLGLAAPTEDDLPARKIVVAEMADELVGMLVDRVLEVRVIPAADVEPPSDLIRGDRAEFLRGVAKTSDGLIVMLSLDRVLNLDERRQVTELELTDGMV